MTDQSKLLKPAELDQLCINTIRFLSIDAVQKANSGHPGLPLGAAPMAYVLWTRFLRHNPRNPKWPDHDRFAFSAGHGSMLLYSLLYLTGYDLTLDDLKHFRQWGSKTPGHPEYGLVPGADQVFAQDNVHRGLASDGTIYLREQSRRHLHIGNSAMINRRNKSGEIAHYPAAQCDEKRGTIQT